MQNTALKKLKITQYILKFRREHTITKIIETLDLFIAVEEFDHHQQFLFKSESFMFMNMGLSQRFSILVYCSSSKHQLEALFFHGNFQVVFVLFPSPVVRIHLHILADNPRTPSPLKSSCSFLACLLCLECFFQTESPQTVDGTALNFILSLTN